MSTIFKEVFIFLFLLNPYAFPLHQAPRISTRRPDKGNKRKDNEGKGDRLLSLSPVPLSIYYIIYGVCHSMSFYPHVFFIYPHSFFIYPHFINICPLSSLLSASKPWRGACELASSSSRSLSICSPTSSSGCTDMLV